ncbi:cutinase family protein [Streptomyces sp. BK239]|uniref:cutinase family protein n=1 Tax=Streptomyces sp. BK239 TaxID=2512155 RepID=UPI0013EF2AFB|nr:cutinase family protein [Streptomyces sp. BK239]
MPVLAVAIALLTPSTASAQGEAITLSPTQGPVNTPVTVHGTGWQDYFSRGLDVPINIGTQQLADAHPDSNGEFTVTITIPESTPLGVTRVDAILGNGGSASASFTVTEPGSVPPSAEEEPSVPPLDLTPGETSEGSAQQELGTGQPLPTPRCEKGVRTIYVPGYNDGTDGTWAADPLKERLKKKGVTVLNGKPDKVDYLGARGGANIPARESVTDDGRDKLLAKLKSLPADECFVLIGYSTGVIAIEKTLTVLPAPLGSRIVAVELFADPVNVAPLPHKVPAAYSARVRYECNETDPLCSLAPIGTHTAEEKQKCKEEQDAVKAGRKNALDTAGPCLTPAHLTDAYKSKAEDAAEWAASQVPGGHSTPSHLAVAVNDTLWDLAATYLGNATDWRAIYNANRSLIERTAQAYGRPTSDNGHWIFPGTTLALPATA